jgi:hypothetical protein
MTYAKIKNGEIVQFPYGMDNLRSENPHTNYYSSDVDVIFATTNTAIIDGYEVVPVTMLPSPEHDQRTQLVTLGEPALVDGEWTVGWIVTNKTQEQLDQANANQAAQVRADRNAKLTSSDWTQVSDAPGNKAAWAAYRKALRDISDQAGFPWTITWPTKPE